MNDEKYIGLDVHQATIVVAVPDSTGKLVMESILETKAATILQFFAGLRGTLSVTFEEGTWSAWLYDLLHSRVDKLVVCNPPGKPLNYVGINKRNRVHRYYSTIKRCRGCEQKPQCTRGQFRTIGIHTCDAARQKAYEVAKTPEFAVALRKRRKVEALFSELKNLIGLRRLRLRRIKFVREQFYLAAVAQNLKRLVRFLNRRAQSAMATA